MTSERTSGKEWKRKIGVLAVVAGAGFVLFSNYNGLGAALLVGGGLTTLVTRLK